jgi:sec-independent protein translocase protein TatC
MRRIPRNGDMPFLDHLEELRWRIIWSLFAIASAIVIGFFVVLRFDVISLLELPILPYLRGHRVIATHPTDGLQIIVRAAMWIGAVMAFPVVLYQAWLFLSPALFPREKRLLIAALTGGIVLFAAGSMFAYAVVLPLSLPVLFNLFGTALEPMITAENYFGFVFSLVLTFGFAFELPVVVLLLTAAGLVTPQTLSRLRRHAIVLIFVAGAVLTPGDVLTSAFALALPLYVLFELSVLIAHAIWRKRKPADTIAILLAPLLLLRSRPAARAS